MAKAERIDCPAPLPEDPATALLKEMLVLAPYEVPEKKAKKRSTVTRKSLRRKVVSDSSSEDTEAHSSNDNEEEEEENPLPPKPRGRIKGRPPLPGRPKGPRREGPSPRTTPPMPTTMKRSGHQGLSPWPHRKCPDPRIIQGISFVA